MLYDTVVIGAGMSGLAAGIRLAMFDKKVLILEKHLIPGGLNSYYSRGKRQFDVGLHALTNFAKKEDRTKPLSKLLKQLRFKHEDLKLKEQSFSVIDFPETKLKFTNDFNLMLSEIEKKFPHEINNFLALVEQIKSFNEVDLNNQYQSAKLVVGSFIKDELLLNMIFCPLLIYGSAWENDMDFSQFVIMFKSIYLEGFSRPDGGVRTIIDLLIEKYKSLNGELRFKTAVQKISKIKDIFEIQLDNGEVLTTKKILSSMGYPETARMTEGLEAEVKKLEIGRLSFTEAIFVTKEKIASTISDATIIFRNNSPVYHYQAAADYFDPRSSVICLTDNFKNESTSTEGIVRVTNMANFNLWNDLLKQSKNDYNQLKEKVKVSALAQIKEVLGHFNSEIVFSDVFTPTTITRYTSHLSGTVYGSTTKTRDGRTAIPGLYIIGTDQGFLGIIGSMLSGISMANLHCLMESEG